MPTKEEDPEHGYRDDGIVNGNSNNPSQESKEKAGHDLEVGPSKRTGSAGKNDPFGDERTSEVKYRTMTWWSVAFSTYHTITRLTGHSQASRNGYAIQARDCKR